MRVTEYLPGVTQARPRIGLRVSESVCLTVTVILLALLLAPATGRCDGGIGPTTRYVARDWDSEEDDHRRRRAAAAVPGRPAGNPLATALLLHIFRLDSKKVVE